MPRLPFLKYSRTLSAWSASMELECVFFSVTPTAVKRVENFLALDFEFPCQIVDSNFAHPVLFRGSGDPAQLFPCAVS